MKTTDLKCVEGVAEKCDPETACVLCMRQKNQRRARVHSERVRESREGGGRGGCERESEREGGERAREREREREGERKGKEKSKR
jgi:hypothetical protein